MMRITYLANSFLDYRVPVFEALNKKLDGGLTVIYSNDNVREAVSEKIKSRLGENAVGLTGEKVFGLNDPSSDFANKSFRIVYQAGILREISKSKPDVVVGDGFYQWSSFALAHKIKYGTPLVVAYERTKYTERNAQWIRTFYRRQVLRFVDAMTVNGSLSKEYVEWLGMPSDRITIGHMAGDTEYLSIKANDIKQFERQKLRSKWANPDLVFLTVSQLIPRKGITQLLNGWARLSVDVNKRCHLVIVGSGHQAVELIEKAKELGLLNISFEGSVDYSLISEYYSAADIFVMPTLEDNWSLVVPEAMACGLPIMCSKYNGCYPEMIADNINGWVFDPLDEIDTHSVLMKCIANRNTLKDMGVCSKNIINNWSPENAAEAIFNACVIAKKPR